MVLVGRDGDEGRLGEDVGAERRVFGAKAVVLVGLDDVEPRLVLVHGVENYLHRGQSWRRCDKQDLPCPSPLPPQRWPVSRPGAEWTLF